MRFVVLQDQEENSEQPWEGSIISERSLLSSSHDNKRQALSADIPVDPRLKIPPVRNRQRCRSAAEWLQKALQKSCQVGHCSIAKFWLFKRCHGEPFASDKRRFGSGPKTLKKR